MGTFSHLNNGLEGGPWTKDWKPFTGYYEKSMVDIITKSGEQVNVCWPNAGQMHGGGKHIKYENIDQVRLTHDPFWQE